ncbi:MAG: LCCL domain-containing protein [Cyanobacteria bacterium P01_G01_bin.19]
MKISKLSSNIKLIALGIALTLGTASFTPAHGEELDEYVPEIGWSSRISSMGLDREDNLKEKYVFNCQSAPEDLIHAPIWGTRVYTANSGICSSAVHSGIINPEEGGEIVLRLIKGKQFYTGSKKNNVKSKDHTATDFSFVFINNGNTVKKRQEQETAQKKRKPSGIERVLMEGFQRGVERTIEKAIIDILE